MYERTGLITYQHGKLHCVRSILNEKEHVKRETGNLKRKSTLNILFHLFWFGTAI